MKQTDPLLRDIYKYIEENIRAKKPGNDPNASLRVDFLNYDYQHAFKSLEDKVIKKHWLEAENIMTFISMMSGPSLLKMMMLF